MKRDARRLSGVGPSRAIFWILLLTVLSEIKDVHVVAENELQKPMMPDAARQSHKGNPTKTTLRHLGRTKRRKKRFSGRSESGKGLVESGSCQRAKCPLLSEIKPRFRDVSLDVMLSGASGSFGRDTARHYESALQKTLEEAFTFFCPEGYVNVLLVEVQGQSFEEATPPSETKSKSKSKSSSSSSSSSSSYSHRSRFLAGRNTADTRVVMQLNPAPPSVNSRRLIQPALSDTGRRRRQLHEAPLRRMRGRSKEQLLGEYHSRGASPSIQCDFNQFINNLLQTDDPYFDSVGEIETIVRRERFFEMESGKGGKGSGKSGKGGKGGSRSSSKSSKKKKGHSSKGWRT